MRRGNIHKNKTVIRHLANKAPYSKAFYTIKKTVVIESTPTRMLGTQSQY